MSVLRNEVLEVKELKNGYKSAAFNNLSVGNEKFRASITYKTAAKENKGKVIGIRVYDIPNSFFGVLAGVTEFVTQYEWIYELS
jgi:hypothetical protein